MSSSNIGISKWKHVISKESWKIKDSYKLDKCQKLSSLLQSIFSYFDKDVILADGIAPYGYHFIFNNPSSENVGPDGYYNYQAPIMDNGKMYKRRMWVSGNLRFQKSISIGSTVACEEKITNTKTIRGSSYIKILRTIQENQHPSLTEVRVLAYTDSPFRYSNNAIIKNDLSALIPYPLRLTEKQVRSFSELTSNRHKIHIDEIYSRNVEMLPGIIVQGPFMVTMALYCARKKFDGMVIESFTYKNVNPWPIDTPANILYQKQGDKMRIMIADELSVPIFEGVLEFKL